jgi:uncharacterized protein YecE (DUF72 family)
MAGQQINIGTSGWYYKHWWDVFYPETLKADERFAYYQQFFNTVELNNTFYRVAPPETFEKWRKAVPKDFVYAVKANRYFTHIKRLETTENRLDDFFERISILKKNLGPVLFQLHPTWKFNEERLANFLKLLPKNLQFTFEFRNPTWYNDAAYSLLEKHNCGFCIYHLAGHLSPLVTTSDLVYIRLHGPGGKYQGSYTKKELRQWATRCKQWASEGKKVYLYFDNDQAAYAAFNAIDLIKMVSKA